MLPVLLTGTHLTVLQVFPVLLTNTHLTVLNVFPVLPTGTHLTVLHVLPVLLTGARGRDAVSRLVQRLTHHHEAAFLRSMLALNDAAHVERLLSTVQRLLAYLWALLFKLFKNRLMFRIKQILFSRHNSRFSLTHHPF